MHCTRVFILAAVAHCFALPLPSQENMAAACAHQDSLPLPQQDDSTEKDAHRNTQYLPSQQLAAAAHQVRLSSPLPNMAAAEHRAPLPLPLQDMATAAHRAPLPLPPQQAEATAAVADDANNSCSIYFEIDCNIDSEMYSTSPEGMSSFATVAALTEGNTNNNGRTHSVALHAVVRQRLDRAEHGIIRYDAVVIAMLRYC